MSALVTEPAETRAFAAGNRWQHRHYGLMVGLAVVQMIIRAEMPLGQDMTLGARFGGDFLDTGHLARHDTYSWNAHGRVWVPNSWGWNVVQAVAYRTMGVVGFWVLGAALAMIMALTVARLASGLGASPKATAAVYAPVGLLGLAAVPRAQTVSTILVLVVPMLVGPLVSVEPSRWRRAVFSLVALQVVWINIHSAALIGPVLIAAVGTAAVVTSRRQLRMRVGFARVGLATTLTAAASLATPYGTAPITHAKEVRDASVGLIDEWDHVGFATVPQVLGLLAVLGGAALSVYLWRAQRAATAATVAVLTLATAGAIRFLPMLAIVAAPEVAVLVGRLRVRTGMFTVIVSATTGVLCVFAILGARDLRSLGDTMSPGLVAQLPSHCRLLNDDSVGDAVTLLRRDVLVSLDGRNDMYGRKLIIGIENLFDDRPGSDADINRDKITCILGPSDKALVRRLAESPDWTVTGHDSLRTLLVRAGTVG